MIKYDAIQKKYLYNPEDIEKVLNVIQNGNYYDLNNCTQEKISLLVKSVEDFMSNMEVISEKVTLERHETEEEAREYFGEDFIKKFDELLTTLDNQETIVALHGTDISTCPIICDTGLQYKLPSINATSVQQHMEYGQKEMHYEHYEELLNWGHKNYKGLVILAIPYECYYKEGLWNHFQETNSYIYGCQDYKIDSDFVVGYIDVTNKEIVLNPKYNREHNYKGYEVDDSIFRERKDMNNNKYKQASIELNKKIEEEKLNPIQNTNEENKEEQIDISRIPYIIEDLIGTFNSIKIAFPNGMPERRYKLFLEELSYGFNDIAKNIHLLKTDDEVKKEYEEKMSLFNKVEHNPSDQFDIFGDYEWPDDKENEKHM